MGSATDCRLVPRLKHSIRKSHSEFGSSEPCHSESPPRDLTLTHSSKLFSKKAHTKMAQRQLNDGDETKISLQQRLSEACDASVGPIRRPIGGLCRRRRSSWWNCSFRRQVHSVVTFAECPVCQRGATCRNSPADIVGWPATNPYAVNGIENRISYLVGVGHHYRASVRERAPKLPLTVGRPTYSGFSMSSYLRKRVAGASTGNRSPYGPRR